MKNLLLGTLVIILGVVNLGYSDLAFAEKSSIMYNNSNAIGYVEKSKEFLEKNEIFEFGLHSTSGLKINTHEIKDKIIDFSENDNRGNIYPQTVRSAIRTFKHTDSMTLNTSLQFSFGEELSGSIDLPILAKITGKFSAQQIINAGISKFSSNEESISYGGDVIEAHPNQLKKIEYIYKEHIYSGEINTGTPITGVGELVEIRTNNYRIPANGLKYAEIYNYFKKIKSLNVTEDIRVYKRNVNNEQYSIAYFTIPVGRFDNYFFIDDVSRTVSTAGNRALVNGISGIGLTIRTITM